MILAGLFFLDEANVGSTRSSSGKITIWSDYRYNEYLTSRINKVMEESDKISIKLENKNEEEILQAINSDDKDKPDIVILNSGKLELANKENIVRADYLLEDYKNNFYKGRLKEIKDDDGSTLGVPISSNPQMLYIDKNYIEGMNIDHILTWDDFINLGISIKSKLNENEVFLSLNSEEYKNFLEILYTQQGVGKIKGLSNDDKNKVKENTIEMINKLKSEGLLSVNSNKKSVCHIGSNDEYQKLITNLGEENIISNDLPSFILGANGSVSLQGDNYIILSTKKKELIKQVLISFITNTDNVLTEMNKGSFFISYAKAYKKNEFGKSPYPQMVNVEGRAIEVDYRSILNEIVEETINTK